MADLAITVDMSSVTQAEKKVNSFQNQLNRLIKKQREGAISDEAFAKGKLEIKKAYKELGVHINKASGQVEKYVRDINKAKKAQDRAADMQKWFTNQRRKMRMMEESVRIEQQQIRSQERLREKYVPLYAASKRYERALDEINQAHREGVFSTQQYNNAIEQLNADFARTRQVGVGNTRSMNNFGVAMQQSGYQVGDFLVQVQSGTNAFVAFGQQATQLVGILPMFADNIKFLSSTALIGLSAGLGIVIPLVTALGAAFMRTRQEADEASSNVESFESKLESARSTVQGMADDLELIRSGFEDVFEKTLVDAVDKAEKNLRNAREELQQLQEGGVAGRTERGRERSLERDIEGAEEAVRLAELELASAREIARQKKEQERSESVINQLHEIRQERVQQGLEAQKEYNERIARVSGIMKTIQRDTEVLNSDLISLAGNVTSSGLEAIKLAQALKDGEISARSLSGVDVSAGISPAVKEAKRLSEELGVALRTAMAISGAIVRDNTVSLDPRSQRYEPKAARTQRIRDLMGGFNYQTTSPFEGGNDPGVGGSSGGGSGQTDPIEKLRQQIRLQEQLVGKSEAQQRVIKALGVDWQSYGEKTVSSLVASIEEIDRMNQRIEDQEKLTETISQGFGDMFLSIIDGSKSAGDAIRDFARMALTELWKVAVMRPLQNQFSDIMGPALGAMVPSADGNVFQNGHLQAFANGGIVNQPTVFPMANGAGLMGEAGPEAIMPLKRGKDGKLGVITQENSRPVVVNQTFNFAANGDESVKRIIAGEAPKIAKLTKDQIIDARRRGGVMKQTFGG